jgi:hypothetical protein
MLFYNVTPTFIYGIRLFIAQENQQRNISITVQSDVKGVVNAENGSVINQTIS